MSKQEEVTQTMIKGFKREFDKNIHNKIMMDAVTKVSVNDVAMSRKSIINMDFTFSHELETGNITYQKKSGRCWIFAGTNTLRIYLMRKLNLKQFELSQSYPFFYDKLEKSNYFLENIIDTIDEDVMSRVVMWLLSAPINDGGQWDMFINLVEKYGAVPKNVYPETFNSSNSAIINSLLTHKLREYASILRDMRKKHNRISSIRKKKNEMMKEVYRFLAISFGVPPEKFDFEYRDKKNKFHRYRKIKPQEFYKKFIGLDLRDYASLINAPMGDKKYNTTYTVKYLGNIKGGKDVLYLNLPIETLKSLAVKQLKDNEPVWFGCDVGKYSDRKIGIMDTDLYDYNLVFNTDFSWDKGKRLDYGESKLTHAMVFIGVNLVNGKPVRWKVENSWGKDSGKKGYFVMSDNWFNEFLYQVVINKKYMPQKIRQLLKKKPVILPPWDPMGSLAQVG
ncbi:MAG: aminopeptidase [Candidatus Cloacimonas sp. 4484_209]|nr:MAG: aminopeptidase [Candidatus Cloacimonas sp. 4484_209]